MNLGARYGQHDSAHHPSRRIGSFRWWLVRPGTLVLIKLLGVVGGRRSWRPLSFQQAPANRPRARVATTRPTITGRRQSIAGNRADS